MAAYPVEQHEDERKRAARAARRLRYIMDHIKYDDPSEHSVLMWNAGYEKIRRDMTAKWVPASETIEPIFRSDTLGIKKVALIGEVTVSGPRFNRMEFGVNRSMQIDVDVMLFVIEGIDPEYRDVAVVFHIKRDSGDSNSFSMIRIAYGGPEDVMRALLNPGDIVWQDPKTRIRLRPFGTVMTNYSRVGLNQDLTSVMEVPEYAYGVFIGLCNQIERVYRSLRHSAS
jgi:hypothetical protein